ncbi:hypothetical protein [Larkinella sp. C7]|uniref:hypothetical protein n=1 Tax=Larkinella sp. C7 TaxID=2576607 RepID=UPI00111104BE|nr:hypothetical protein [Larkinella sp. C7]
MPTAFERTLERVQNGESITVAVRIEYRSWRKYYDKATPEERRQVSAARQKFHYNKPGRALALKRAEETENVRLIMPVSRKKQVQTYCREKGISVSRYINSLIIYDQVRHTNSRKGS